MSSMQHNILIYRDHLLAPSETFIKSQGESLQSFRPYYMGSRMVQGLELPSEYRILLNEGNLIGRFREVRYKLTGYCGSILRQLRALEPRLVHAHFGPDGVLASEIAGRLEIPLVVTFHGYDVTTTDRYAESSYFTHRNYIRKRPQLQRQGELFIAVSRFIERELLHQGYPEDKVCQHYIGIDTQVFVPDPVAQREPIVLFVGRLVEVKGCAYLIQAMEEVQRVDPTIELVLIGDGPLRAELEAMAAKRLVKYRFLGVQPPEAVRFWMNRAKLFSVPSITAASGAKEGLGMVFLEAGAMGLPVVSFSTGGITEAVEHQHTGMLALEKDWQSLTRYILMLMQDEELWLKCSRSGQERVKKNFSLDQQNRKLESIYHQLLNHHHTQEEMSERRR